MSAGYEPHGRRILRLFDLNPEYGTGAFRRRVRLRHDGRRVIGRLIDNNHEISVRLDHDHGVVVAIAGQFERWPTDACPGAPAVLRELVGTPLTMPEDELRAGGRSRRHCTHLYDLALLALAHAARAPGERLWDADVPDPVDGRTEATITLDGEVVHRWPLRAYQIVLDEDRPQSLATGFRSWAAARFSGDALEGAFILRMAAFTARARAHITDNVPRPLREFDEREGACFAYSLPQVATALHTVGVVRDFSAGIVEEPGSFDEVSAPSAAPAALRSPTDRCG